MALSCGVMRLSHLFRAALPLFTLLLVIAELFGTVATGAEPPPANYIPDSSYYLLMAEIAVQREEYLTAAEEYSNAVAQSTDPELARRATEFAFEFGFDGYAMSGVRQWIALDPENRLAHEYAGRLALRRNDLSRSLEHWRAVLGPLAERTDEDYFSLAADLGDEENAVGVTTVLTRLATDDPDSVALRLVLGQAAFRSGAYELALGCAERAALSDPEWIEPQILQARSLLALGAEYQGLEIMEALLEQQPFLGIELEFVRMLAASDRVTQAMENLRELAKKYGVHPELVRMHGLLSLAQKDFDRAEQDFTELANRGEDVYESFYYLGQIELARGNYEQAIRTLKRINGGAYLFPAQLSISSAYHSLGKYQSGIKHLKQFGKDYPHFAVDSLGPQAQLLIQQGRLNDALAEYDRLLRLRPLAVDVMVLRAVLLEESGHLNEAIEEMRRALEIAPLNASVVNTLGYTLANRTRRLSEAYRLIRLALELEPESPAVIDSMGWVLYRQGELELSRSYLELAYSMMDDPELVAHLGEVLWATGEEARATELWDASLAQYPDSKPLKATRQKYLP
jgi:tetratricopeptide (TPR) repeat protein